MRLRTESACRRNKTTEMHFHRQWDDPNYGGTRVDYNKAQFVEKVCFDLTYACARCNTANVLILHTCRNACCKECASIIASSAWLTQVHQIFKDSGAALVDGYAPFCKHVFVPNFVGAKVGALEVNSTPGSFACLGWSYNSFD
jgi:hypothetical protein